MREPRMLTLFAVAVAVVSGALLLVTGLTGVLPGTGGRSTPAGAEGSGGTPEDAAGGGSGGQRVPGGGNGRFAAAPAGNSTIGTGDRLVRYRVEVEGSIDWDGIAPWRPADFAAVVDRVLAAPRGWARSGVSPVTDEASGMHQRSWSFRRVIDGYDVRIRLATPETVDRVCGEAGMDTEGVYSCRTGETAMINLRRWLYGAPGYPVSIEEYRTGVINHELGHFLGFQHMTCGEPGGPAPVMQQQTIDLGACRPNVYPFTRTGRLITGPWTQ